MKLLILCLCIYLISLNGNCLLEKSERTNTGQNVCPADLREKIIDLAETAYNFYANDIQKNIEYINLRISRFSSPTWVIYIFPNCTNSSQFEASLGPPYDRCYIQEFLLEYQKKWLYTLISAPTSVITSSTISLLHQAQGNSTQSFQVASNNLIMESRSLYTSYLQQCNFIREKLYSFNKNLYYVMVVQIQLSEGWVLQRIFNNEWILLIEPNSQDRYLIYRQHNDF